VSIDYDQKKENSMKKRNKVIYVLANKLNYILLFFYFYTVAFNLCIVSAKPTNQFPEYYNLNIAIKIMGIIHACLSGIVLILYYLKSGGYLNSIEWVNHLDSTKSYILEPWDNIVKALGVSPIVYFFGSIKNLIVAPKALYYIFFLLFSILGCIFSPYFFALHLSLIFLLTTQTKDILKAINGVKFRLIIMIVVLFSWVYMWSIIIFLYYPEHFESQNIPCQSMIMCYLSAVYFGIPSQGGIYQHVQTYLTDPWSGDVQSVGEYLYVGWIILLFLINGSLLLNIVFATIVDSFGGIREVRGLFKEELNSSCFICSIDRETFQKYSKDFNQHIENDHNKLHYLYFFAYLKNKKKLETQNNNNFLLSPIEKEILQKVSDRKFIKFFPIGKAKCLENEEENVEENLKILRDRTDTLDKKITQNNTQQEKLLKNISDLSRSVIGKDITVDQKQSQDIQLTLMTVIDGMKELKQDMDSLKREVSKIQH